MIDGLTQTVFIVNWGSEKQAEEIRYFGATKLVDASVLFATKLQELNADDTIHCAYVHLGRVRESDAQPGGTLAAWTKMDEGYKYSEGETSLDAFK